MPRFRLPGDEGDRFEGELFRQGKRPGAPVRGEIEGGPMTPQARGCFGLTGLLHHHRKSIVYQGVKNLDLGQRKRLPSKELRPIRGTRRRKFFVASDLRRSGKTT